MTNRPKEQDAEPVLSQGDRFSPLRRFTVGRTLLLMTWLVVSIVVADAVALLVGSIWVEVYNLNAALLTVLGLSGVWYLAPYKKWLVTCAAWIVILIFALYRFRPRHYIIMYEESSIPFTIAFAFGGLILVLLALLRDPSGDPERE
jgi:hypothetical protein